MSMTLLLLVGFFVNSGSLHLENTKRLCCICCKSLTVNGVRSSSHLYAAKFSVWITLKDFCYVTLSWKSGTSLLRKNPWKDLGQFPTCPQAEAGSFPYFRVIWIPQSISSLLFSCLVVAKSCRLCTGDSHTLGGSEFPVPWFNPRQQLSPTPPLAHSPASGQGRDLKG